MRISARKEQTKLQGGVKETSRSRKKKRFDVPDVPPSSSENDSRTK